MSEAAQRAALLQAVLDAPDDIATRRIYADALSGEGDPRGEFIHVQCDLAEATPTDPRRGVLATRERSLLGKHRKTWIAPFAKAVHSPSFKRGMIEGAFVKATFTTAVGELLAREPVTSLSMHKLTIGQAAALGPLPQLARLRKLRVAESSLGVRGATALFSPRLSNLRDLDLYQAGIDDGGLARLRETVFPQLERLVLSGNRLSPHAVDSLLYDKRLSKLTSLALAWALPDRAGAEQVARRLELPALTELDLSSQRYTNAALAALVENETIARLRSLRLEYNQLVGAGLDELARLTQLERLNIGTNQIGIAGASALAASGMPLKSLALGQAKLGDNGVRALAHGRFPDLAELDLQYCDVGPKGVAAIAKTPWPLTHLNLWANSIGDDGAGELAGASWTGTMRALTLGYCDLTDAGIEAVTAGSWPALERIVFRGDRIGEAGARAFAKSTTMPALRSLVFQGTGTPKSPLTSLLKRGVDLEFSK